MLETISVAYRNVSEREIDFANEVSYNHYFVVLF